MQITMEKSVVTKKTVHSQPPQQEQVASQRMMSSTVGGSTSQKMYTTQAAQQESQKMSISQVQQVQVTSTVNRTSISQAQDLQKKSITLPYQERIDKNLQNRINNILEYNSVKRTSLVQTRGESSEYLQKSLSIVQEEPKVLTIEQKFSSAQIEIEGLKSQVGDMEQLEEVCFLQAIEIQRLQRQLQIFNLKLKEAEMIEIDRKYYNKQIYELDSRLKQALENLQPLLIENEQLKERLQTLDQQFYLPLKNQYELIKKYNQNLEKDLADYKEKLAKCKLIEESSQNLGHIIIQQEQVINNLKKQHETHLKDTEELKKQLTLTLKNLEESHKNEIGLSKKIDWYKPEIERLLLIIADLQKQISEKDLENEQLQADIKHLDVEMETTLQNIEICENLLKNLKTKYPQLSTEINEIIQDLDMMEAQLQEDDKHIGNEHLQGMSHMTVIGSPHPPGTPHQQEAPQEQIVVVQENYDEINENLMKIIMKQEEELNLLKIRLRKDLEEYDLLKQQKIEEMSTYELHITELKRKMDGNQILQNEIDRLKSIIGLKEEQIQSLQILLSTPKYSKSQYEEKYEQLQQDIEILYYNGEKIQSERDQYYQEIMELKETITEYTTTISEFNNTDKFYQNEMNNWMLKVENLEFSLQQKEDNISSFNMLIQQEKSRVEIQIEGLLKQIQFLKLENETQLNEINAQKIQYKEKCGEIPKLKALLANQQINLANLQQLLDARDQTNSQNDQLLMDIEKMKSTFKIQQNQLTQELNVQINNYRTESESYLNELNMLKIQYKEKCMEIPKLKALLSNQQINLSNLQQQLDARDSISGDNEQLVREINSIKNSFQNEKNSIKQELNLTINQYKSESETYLRELNDLKIQYKAKCMEIPQLKALLSNQQINLTNLQQQLDTKTMDGGDRESQLLRDINTMTSAFKTEKYNMAQELQIIIKQLQSDNEMLLKELNELKIIYKEKCMEIPKLKAQLSNQQITLAILPKLQDDIARYEQETKNLNYQIITLQQQLNSRASEGGDRESSLLREITTLKTTFQNDQYRISQEFNTIINQLRQENQSLLKELNELKIKYKEKSMEIPKLKAQLSNQQITLSNLPKMQEDIDKYSVEVQNLNQYIEELERKLERKLKSNV